MPYLHPRVLCLYGRKFLLNMLPLLFPSRVHGCFLILLLGSQCAHHCQQLQILLLQALHQHRNEVTDALLCHSCVSGIVLCPS